MMDKWRRKRKKRDRKRTSRKNELFFGSGTTTHVTLFKRCSVVSNKRETRERY